MKTPILLIALFLAADLFGVNWPVYKSPDGKFSIAMPGKVMVKRRQNRYPFGVVTITAHTHAQDKDTVWRVVTHDYPEAYMKATPSDKLLDVMAKGMAKNVKGKLDGPRPIKLGDLRGANSRLPPMGRKAAQTTHGFTWWARVFINSPSSPSRRTRR